GVPRVAASPREQIMRWAGRPALVSLAITAPQPNSMSSGWAPKASRVGGSGQFDVGFIGSINGVATQESDLGRFRLVEVGLFPRSGDVMSAPDNGLHPAQAGIAR